METNNNNEMNMLSSGASTSEQEATKETLKQHIRNNNLEAVRNILQDNNWYNPADEYGQETIKEAIETKNNEMALLLLQHSQPLIIDPSRLYRNVVNNPYPLEHDENHIKNMTVGLLHAVNQGNLLAMEYFVENGANIDANSPDHISPLYIAMNNNDEETVKWLMENLDIRLDLTFEHAIYRENTQVMRLLMPHIPENDHQFHLLNAITWEKLESIKLILEHLNVDLNKVGMYRRTPLDLCLGGPNHSVTILLLENGATNIGKLEDAIFSVIKHLNSLFHEDSQTNEEDKQTLYKIIKLLALKYKINLIEDDANTQECDELCEEAKEAIKPIYDYINDPLEQRKTLASLTKGLQNNHLNKIYDQLFEVAEFLGPEEMFRIKDALEKEQAEKEASSADASSGAAATPDSASPDASSGAAATPESTSTDASSSEEAGSSAAYGSKRADISTSDENDSANQSDKKAPTHHQEAKQKLALEDPLTAELESLIEFFQEFEVKGQVDFITKIIASIQENLQTFFSPEFISTACSKGLIEAYTQANPDTKSEAAYEESSAASDHFDGNYLPTLEQQDFTQLVGMEPFSGMPALEHEPGMILGF